MEKTPPTKYSYRAGDWIAPKDFSKGSVHDLDPSDIDDGAFSDMLNACYRDGVITRRPGLKDYADIRQDFMHPVMFSAIYNAGTSYVSIIFTTRHAWIEKTKGNWQLADATTYGAGTIEISGGDTITGTATNFDTSGIDVGDILDVGLYLVRISVVDGASEMHLDACWTKATGATTATCPNVASSTSYVAYLQSFSCDTTAIFMSAICPDLSSTSFPMYFCNGVDGIFKYDKLLPVGNAGNAVVPVLFKAITEPGALTATNSGGGTGPAGPSYYYKVTYVTGTGAETALGVASTVVAGSGKTINLTAIPVYSGSGKEAVVARRIYRTNYAAGDDSLFYLLHEIGDNTTASYDDTIIDADLDVTDASSQINSTYDISNATAIGSFKNCLFFFGTTETSVYCSNMVRWSDVGHPETVVGGIAGFYLITESLNQVICSSGRQDLMYIYQKGGPITSVRFAGSDALFVYEVVVPDNGPIAPKTLLSVSGVDFFLSKNGPCLFSGTQEPSLIMEDNWIYAKSKMNDSLISSAFAVYDPDYNEIRLFVTDADTEGSNKVWVFNIEKKSWWEWVLPVGSAKTICVRCSGQANSQYPIIYKEWIDPYVPGGTMANIPGTYAAQVYDYFAVPPIIGCGKAYGPYCYIFSFDDNEMVDVPDLIAGGIGPIDFSLTGKNFEHLTEYMRFTRGEVSAYGEDDLVVEISKDTGENWITLKTITLTDYMLQRKFIGNKYSNRFMIRLSCADGTSKLKIRDYRIYLIERTDYEAG